MKTTTKKTSATKKTFRSAAAAAAELAAPAHDDALSDDELEIRYSLTALGELAVAATDRNGRGRRFRGFGPCGAVA